MKLAALVSGGKDSAYAVYIALKLHKITTLVSIYSKNKESFMFHTPNIHLTELFSKACDIPLIIETSSGKKDLELEDLKKALKKCDVDGVVVGAIESEYQKSRIKHICDTLGLEIIAPLWHMDPYYLMNEIVKMMDVRIVHVAALGLDKDWLGKRLDEKSLIDLKRLSKKYKIHIAGEGGEYETLVLDAPYFKKKIELVKTKTSWYGDRGGLEVLEAKLTDKPNHHSFS